MIVPALNHIIPFSIVFCNQEKLRPHSISMVKGLQKVVSISTASRTARIFFIILLFLPIYMVFPPILWYN